MSKLQAMQQEDGSIKLIKSNQKVTEENAKLAQKLDYITKEEMIEAIKKIADKVGVEVSFTYDNLKNDI